MGLAPGFLGTRADLMMDVVLVSFIAILPALLVSWHQVRHQHYRKHRLMQLSLGAVLAVTVALFELNMKLSGGIFVMTAGSAYSGTWLLNSLIYFHSGIAVVTAIIWIFLLVLSPARFGNPPEPGPFSARHRRWGRAGMLAMMATGLSAIPLYYVGFVL